MSEEKLILYTIEAKDGIFFQIKDYLKYPRSNLLFDNAPSTQSRCADWRTLPRVPGTIHYLKQPAPKGYYLSLVVPNLVPNAPSIIRGEPWGHFDDENDFLWNEPHRGMSRLYERKVELSEEVAEYIPFEVICLGKLEENIATGNLSFAINENRHISDVEHQIIDKLYFQPPQLSMQPCHLTSQQMLAIIKHHIKENIQPKYARITYDYEAHFVVAKFIQLASPYSKVFDRPGRTSRCKRIKETKMVSQKEFEILNLKPNSNNPDEKAPEMVANSHQELKEKVDNYLKDLMEMINSPLEECPHCQGRGVIVQELNKQEKK